MEIIVYFNGKELINKFSGSIGSTIMKLSLRKGDSFELFPFNYFKDERTDFKGIRLEHHTPSKIENIKYTFFESWNTMIKSKVEIFLTDQY